ncbi:MAG: S41 family peptidase [Opitutaceae bacterium]
MFKRVSFVAVAAFLLGQVLVLGVQYVQGRGFWRSEAARHTGQIRQVLGLINEHYVKENEATYENLSEAALESLLHSLDPHSEYLTAREFQTFRADTRQAFGGIGVQIEMREKRLTVVAPIGGTPGARAGLMRGDQFLKVDDRKVEGLSLDTCLDLLRGKPGSQVALTLFRPRTGETFERSITREIIKVQSVRDVRMLDDAIGYLRILQFGERTGEEFVEALVSLESQGMKALVLDLRDNPGGLLDAAVQVAEPFFNEGEVVTYTQGRHPDSREEIHARPSSPRRDYPVAVLINSGSASASEIVAGALRDTGRAVLVGEKSFGKGSVQTILPLRGGEEAIRLTTALYYLPSGTVINERGLVPDIPITLTVEEDRHLGIQRNRLGLMSEEEFTEQFEFEPIEDRQLSAARDALRGVFAAEARFTMVK